MNRKQKERKRKTANGHRLHSKSRAADNRRSRLKSNPPNVDLTLSAFEGESSTLQKECKWRTSRPAQMTERPKPAKRTHWLVGAIAAAALAVMNFARWLSNSSPKSLDRK